MRIHVAVISSLQFYVEIIVLFDSSSHIVTEREMYMYSKIIAPTSNLITTPGAFMELARLSKIREYAVSSFGDRGCHNHDLK